MLSIKRNHRGEPRVSPSEGTVRILVTCQSATEPASSFWQIR